jgi:hypothetical protein
MKNFQKTPLQIVRISAMLLMVFMSSIAWAQDKGIDINVDIDKKGGNWYSNPIVYVAGAAVFILLLVALLKGGNKSNS